jgi:microsomal dipeptidase-like Zn-dependent dipeptidase
LPGIVAYAKKIKEMVDMYGSDNFCISTNGNDITKNRDKISPFSVLRTELLRLGMSDKNLDNIFFKTSYEFLKQSLS